MRFSPRYDVQATNTLTRCIQELELRTQAEVVLVLRRSSGNYRDIDYLFAAVLAFLLLCFKLYSPWEFHPLSVPLPLILTFGLGARASRVLGRYGPRRFWTRAARRRLQVRHAAQIYFEEKHIDRTRHRAGILLYFSGLEQQAELLADEAAEKALAPRLAELRETLTQACSSPRTIQASVLALAEFLRHLGLHLGEVLPWDRTSGPHASELDDTPDLLGGSEE